MWRHFCRGNAVGREWLTVFMQDQIHLFIVRFGNKVNDLLDLGHFGVVDVLGELKGLAAVLYLQTASGYLIGTIKFQLEVIE